LNSKDLEEMSLWLLFVGLFLLSFLPSFFFLSFFVLSVLVVLITNFEVCDGTCCSMRSSQEANVCSSTWCVDANDESWTE